MRSEFLDTKWRSLLAEIDMTYRSSEDLTSELGADLHENLTVCDWRNSYSDGSKMYSFPIAWPVKPGHVSDFHVSNTLEAALEYTGAITQSSWVAANYLMFPQTVYEKDPLFTGAGDALYGEGSNIITASDAIRKRFLDEQLLRWSDARVAEGKSLPVGIRPAEGRIHPQTVIEELFSCKNQCKTKPELQCQCLQEGFECNETSKRSDAFTYDPEKDVTGCKCVFVYCSFERSSERGPVVRGSQRHYGCVGKQKCI